MTTERGIKRCEYRIDIVELKMERKGQLKDENEVKNEQPVKQSQSEKTIKSMMMVL